jgi:hypothetical protein
MDKLFKALSIANQGMGIAVNYQKVQDISEQRELRPAQELRAGKESTAKIGQAEAAAGASEALTAQRGAETANLPTPEQASRAFEAKLTASKNEALRKFNEGKLKKAADFRREWAKDPTTLATKAGKVSIDKIRSAGQGDPSAAKDHSMIFNYMKTVDPGSTVREGEFATVEQAGGIIDRATIGLFNKALEGEKLTPEQRTDFLSVSENLWQQQVNAQQLVDDNYRGLVDRAGVPQQDVVLDLGIGAGQKAQAPGTGGFNLQGQGQGGAPPPPAPAFSEDDINAVMQGGNFSRGEAIQRLRQAQGGGQ